jgi:hypothetical protein
MLKRLCDNCKTPLPGRKNHGFVSGRKVLCGRSETLKTIKGKDGDFYLSKVKLNCYKY